MGGAVDASAAALEMGVYKDGRVAEMTGTSSVVVIGVDGLVTGEELSYLRGIRENTTVLFGAMNTAGGSLKWFRDALYKSGAEKMCMMKLIERLKRSFRANRYYLSSVYGRRACTYLGFGCKRTFIGLNLNTNRADIMRSIMEGTCFALQDNLDQAVKFEFR